MSAELCFRGLAEYYKTSGDSRRASETWSRVVKSTAWPPERPMAMVYAALLARQAGAASQVDDLATRVLSSGNGWAISLALVIRSQGLMAQGRHDEARMLLSKEVVGSGADKGAVAVLSCRAYSCYRTGDLAMAAKYSEASIAQYESLGRAAREEDLSLPLRQAQDMLMWIGRWKKGPIACEPGETRTVTRQEPYRLVVRVPRVVPLSVRCDSTSIRTQVEEVWREKEYYAEKSVTLSLSAKLPPKDFDTVLEVSSTAFPGFRASVPLHVQGKTSQPRTIDRPN